MKDNLNKVSLGTGVLTAITASLCCITPILAIIAGGSGFASSFTWLEPLRPYLIGFTIFILGFAWYQKLKPINDNEITCDCEVDNKPSFWQTKKFLGIVSVFAVAMLAFPYYADAFYPEQEAKVATVNATHSESIELDIEGMTCKACNFTVSNAVYDLEGVLRADADYKTGKANISFDTDKVNIDELIKAINKTEYKVKK